MYDKLDSIDNACLQSIYKRTADLIISSFGFLVLMSISNVHSNEVINHCPSARFLSKSFNSKLQNIHHLDLVGIISPFKLVLKNLHLQYFHREAENLSTALYFRGRGFHPVYRLHPTRSQIGLSIFKNFAITV